MSETTLSDKELLSKAFEYKETGTIAHNIPPETNSDIRIISKGIEEYNKKVREIDEVNVAFDRGVLNKIENHTPQEGATDLFTRFKTWFMYLGENYDEYYGEGPHYNNNLTRGTHQIMYIFQDMANVSVNHREGRGKSRKPVRKSARKPKRKSTRKPRRKSTRKR